MTGRGILLRDVEHLCGLVRMSALAASMAIVLFLIVSVPLASAGEQSFVDEIDAIWNTGLPRLYENCRACTREELKLENDRENHKSIREVSEELEAAAVRRFPIGMELNRLKSMLSGEFEECRLYESPGYDVIECTIERDVRPPLFIQESSPPVTKIPFKITFKFVASDKATLTNVRALIVADVP